MADLTTLKKIVELGDGLTKDRIREIVIAEIESNEMDGVAQAYEFEEADDEKKSVRKLRLDFLYKINTSQNTLVSYSKLNL